LYFDGVQIGFGMFNSGFQLLISTRHYSTDNYYYYNYCYWRYCYYCCLFVQQNIFHIFIHPLLKQKHFNSPFDKKSTLDIMYSYIVPVFDFFDLATLLTSFSFLPTIIQLYCLPYTPIQLRSLCDPPSYFHLSVLNIPTSPSLFKIYTSPNKKIFPILS